MILCLVMAIYTMHAYQNYAIIIIHFEEVEERR